MKRNLLSAVVYTIIIAAVVFVSLPYFIRTPSVSASSPASIPVLISPIEACSATLTNGALFVSKVTRGAENIITSIGTSANEKRGIEVRF